MNRAALCLVLALSLLPAQQAAAMYGRCGTALQQQHTTRPHIHLTAAPHAHHHAGCGGHRHEADESEPVTAGPLSPPDHDGDAVYLTAVDAGVAARMKLDEYLPQTVGLEFFSSVATALLRPSSCTTSRDADCGRTDVGVTACPLYILQMNLSI